MTGRIYSFEAIHDHRSRLLILGTMPSEASLRQGFYYAHPRNCFWPMLSDLLAEDVPESMGEKRRMLLRNGVALWDVARSCEREGSLDGAIRNAEPNDVGRLLAESPGIQKILFNGGTAWRLFRKLLPGVGEGLEPVRLPSTSPAYPLRYEQKLAAWAKAIEKEGVEA